VATSSQNHVLVIGCGYIGLPLARQLSQKGWDTIALTASPESAARLQKEPFRVFATDISSPRWTEHLPDQEFTVAIHCASSGGRGVDGYRAVYLEGTRNLLSAGRHKHLIFTSSSSVYAQTDGRPVTEDSPADPPTETGKILRLAEELTLAHDGTVARLAGIYGPGRCVPLRKLLAGTATIDEPGNRVLNQIHRDDAAAALSLLAEQKARGIYNVADNRPVTQQEWYTWVCDRVDRPMPPFQPPDLQRKRGWTNKRVQNEKLRRLGWSPRFPSFREGIESILQTDRIHHGEH
jgi:nucleoside-diphosphate-sugar epimerase